jgi:guanylate kinase
VNPFPVVLSAPSGGGKTTVTKRLMAQRRDLAYSISCTTRAPRPGEVNGVDYHFLSDAEFAAKRDAGELAEWAVVHGRMYGTLKASVDGVIAGGRHLMMDIDVQGAEQFAKAYPSAVTIFLLPPSMEVLVGRLEGRQTEAPEAFRTRLESALLELRAAERYQYVVVNDDLDATVARVSSIIDAEEVSHERIHALAEQVAGLVQALEGQIAQRQ